MKFKVLITASGVGAPLGDLTKYTNKALVKVGNKPVISHIIEAYPKNTHFVVTLGYFGDQVRDFLTIAYPDLAVEFVQVDPFVGPGSSQGESMFQAMSKLQCPFIYHASDTIVSELIPEPKENWVGVSKGDDTSQYASWSLREGVLQFHEKGALDADYIHIGLIGVHDYKAFWNTLRSLKSEYPDSGELHDGLVLSRLIRSGTTMKPVEFFTWKDIGNVKALMQVQGSHEVLFKAGESIFVFDAFVVKFFSDSQTALNRAKRANLLKGFVPKLEAAKGNFYRYTFVEGKPYPNVITVSDFEKYLEWAQGKFWTKPKKLIDRKAFKSICGAFYEDKTKTRIQKFFDLLGLEDTEHVINGEKIPSIASMLKKIDFDWLSEGIPSRFHGDFVLDNVLRTKAGYMLVDWRQDFGGELEVGDRYYDLAKLNHNFYVNHSIVSDDLFTVDARKKEVRVDILRPDILIDCQKKFYEFLKENNYDVRKVEILTALNWLNGAALHHYPFNLFLYYFGKLHLARALKMST
jgi:hypothetical protein